jgi:ADP-ribose pyrophosphatase YjhB (NUDIX family)
MTHLGALAVVFERDRVLLTYRTDVPVWILPGGGVEPRESLEQAVVRETHEETGLEVQVTRLVGIYSRPNWRSGGDHQVVVLARVIGGKITTSDETLRVEYFRLDDLPKDLVPWNRVYIRDAAACRNGRLEPFLRAFDMRWPFEDCESTTQAVERLTQSGMSLPEAQREFHRRVLANMGELPER